jgi:diguanylate cyclase (GGDEF)-like protein
VSIEFDALVPLGRRGLVQTTNLVVTIMVASLAILRIGIVGFDSPPIPALFIVITGLANAIYIRRHGSVDVAAWVLVVTSVFTLAAGSFYTGGFGAAVVLLAPIIPVLTMLLIDARAAWISLVLVCSILTGLFFLGIYGYVPENPNELGRVHFGRYVVLTALCLISTWVVWSFSSISRSLLVKLDKQSNTDYLTGVLNRRAIETTLLQEVGRAKRSNTWLTFIMADVDFFKLYNDTNGHQAGDSCLKDIAKLMAECCERSTDVVGRYGGEEFVLILPDTNIEGAQRVAENIRLEILDKNIPYGPKNPNPVSLTLGVVSAQGYAIDGIEQLIGVADKALYEGKNQGRNRVVSVVFGGADTEGFDHRETERNAL